MWVCVIYTLKAVRANRCRRLHRSIGCWFALVDEGTRSIAFRYISDVSIYYTAVVHVKLNVSVTPPKWEKRAGRVRRFRRQIKTQKTTDYKSVNVVTRTVMQNSRFGHHNIIGFPHVETRPWFAVVKYNTLLGFPVFVCTERARHLYTRYNILLP